MTNTISQSPVALVTGAGSGIGRATAVKFAAAGYVVIASDIDREAAVAVAEHIRAREGNGLGWQADVSDATAMTELVGECLHRFGRLDCAFNNAGVEQQRGTVVETSPTEWARTIDINLSGIWRSMRAEIPALQRPGGAIVNCASIAAAAGAAGAAAYSSSKHGVLGLTRSAALELAAEGIRVNAVSPGYIETPMNDRVIAREPHKLAQYEANAPMGRMGTADEVAEAVLWLCSPSASYITGVTIPIDGGLSAK